MRLLILAWKNLFSNVRRTVITLFSIVIGVASLIFLWSFIDGLNQQMIENTTGYVTGDIQIHRQGYHQSKEMNLALTQQDGIEKLLKGMKGIAGYAPRVEGTAMLSVGDQTRAVQIFGVDPKREQSVTRISRSLLQGSWFKPDSGNDIIIGESARKSLKLRLGEKVVIITQAADGSLGADRYRVKAFFKTGINQMDSRLVYMPIKAAQDLYSMQGRYTTIALKLINRNQVDKISASLRKKLGSHREVYDWKQLLPSVVQMIAFHNAVTWIVLFVVFVVVAAGIANTILMSVMERTREFGIMMAVGTQRGQILQLVLIENLLIALIGLAVGTSIGVLITQYFSDVGMNLGQFSSAMETMPGLSGIVHPFLVIDHVVIISIMVLFVSILPALYPAWKASRLVPVEAIQGASVSLFRLPGFLQSKVSTEGNNATIKFQGQWMKFWQIAFRNLFRNPKRSLLTAGATAFGLAAYLFLYSFADGFFEQMIENSISNLSGHIQITQTGFRPDFSPDKRIKKLTPIENLITNWNDDKKPSSQIMSAPRVVVNAMIASARKSLPINLYGIDPAKEMQVTRLQNHIRQGRYLNEKDMQKHANVLVLGKKLANKLKIELGDKVVITLQKSGGDLVSAAFRLVGILDTGSPFFDSTLALTTLESGRKILGFSNNEASSIVLRLPDRSASGSVAALLRTEIAGLKHDPGAASLKVETWDQIMPVVVQMVEMTRIDFYVILAVVFIVVAMGVLNTMLMSVLERSREFGMLIAMGTQPVQVVVMVIFESIILGLLGLLVGGIMGISIVTYYHMTGISLNALVASLSTVPGMTNVVTPVLILDHVIWPTLLLFIIGIAVSFYPALKASRLNPVEAMRHG